MSRPARAREIERRQRADVIDRRIGHLTSRGMGGLLTAMDVARGQFIGAWRQGKSTAPAFDAIFVAMGRASLDATLAGHLTAVHDVHALARLAGRTKKATGFGPYEDALRVARERVSLTAAQVDDLKRRYGAVVLDIVDGVRQSTHRKLEVAVEGIIRDNLHVEEGIERLEAAFDAAGVTGRSRHQVEAIVRSQVQLAYSAGAVQADRDPAVDEILWGYTYSTVGDDRVRPTHEALDGVSLPKDHPQWKWIMPPNGWNSFVPSTRVSGRFEAASKAWYSGPIVEIKTLRGARLSVTVNHPVLTAHGFVAAGELRKGNYLIAHRAAVELLSQRTRQDRVATPSVSRWAVDDQEHPPTIEDVHDAFAREGVLSTFPGCGPMDFHGDGRFMYGDVHIVRPDRVLPGHAVSAALQLAAHVGLVLPSEAALLADEAGSMTRTGGSVGCGVAAEMHAPCDQAIRDGLARGAVLVRQLQNRYAASVTLDEVVDIEVRPWSGHVFDLQSPNGWIVAEGIVCSNCRCTALREFSTGVALETDFEKVPVPDFVMIDGERVIPGADEGWKFNPGDLFPLAA